MKALVIEDDVIKYMGVYNALTYSGVKEITQVRNQEAGIELIYEAIKNKQPYDLIVTDMHYPMRSGEKPDPEAGFKLIERLKKENIDIPVIICSTKNYREPEALGIVWYNDSQDINYEFKVLVERIK